MSIVHVRAKILLIILLIVIVNVTVVYITTSSIAVSKPSITHKRKDEPLQEHYPNIPEIYFNNTKLPKGFNKTCAGYPDILNIEYNNDFWQTLQTSNGTYHFLNAYLDDRNGNLTVRITGMLNRVDPILKVYCQIWYEGDNQPTISQVAYTWIWIKGFGVYPKLYQPYLFSCEVPGGNKKIPSSVSLVEKPCDLSTTNLRVIYEKPNHREEFAVCVKGLEFFGLDMSIRLIEWIELLDALGVAKIYFYEFHTSDNMNMKAVLNYYENNDKIEVNPITLPAGLPNIPAVQHIFLHKSISAKRLHEVVLYNDCFYKNMYKYDWIALLDVDEIVMPKKSYNWSDYMEELLNNSKKPVDYIKHYNAYFLDVLLTEANYSKEIPKYMHMLQHIYRIDHTPEGWYMKSFFNTSSVLTLHNHFPFACLNNKGCNAKVARKDLAQLQHYRKDCASEFKNCTIMKKTSILDDNIFRFKDVLMNNVMKVLEDLPELLEDHLT